MEILAFFIYKLAVFGFIFAVLYLARETFLFFRGVGTGEYRKRKNTLLWVGLSIAYIVTTIITGF